MATDDHETERNAREESTDDPEDERQRTSRYSRAANNPSRYEGQRRPGQTSRQAFRRPEQSGRVQHRRRMREREMGSETPRPRRNEQRRQSEEAEESTTEETEQPTEVPKYGGPCDPDWERRRGRREPRERRSADARQYERRANAILSRQPDVQRDEGRRRYHRGRRG
ncbi:hypothetical protein [Haladaptatus sp. NG-WS-4]